MISKYVRATFLSLREFFQPFLELNSFLLELNLFPRSSQPYFHELKLLYWSSLFFNLSPGFLWEFSELWDIFHGLISNSGFLELF